MKKLLTVMFVGVMLCGASNALAALAGSGHDFSDDAGAAGEDRWSTNATGVAAKCEPCHTPHNADQTTAPLWSHTNTAAASFTEYDDTAPTVDATIGDPNGSSLACLSCHDGQIALDAYGGNAGSGAGNMIDDYYGAAALLGSDLRNDHPISFVYNAALATADGELYDPTDTTGDARASLGGDYIENVLLDASSRVQCASCHDVHNSANQPGMLRMSNNGSALCTTCHNK